MKRRSPPGSAVFVFSMIKSERLLYALYTEKERQDFIDLLTDPAVMRYVDKGVLTVEQAEALWKKLVYQWYPAGVDTVPRA